MKCPLCNSSSNAIESICTEQISILWKRKGIDVAELFLKEDIVKYKCQLCGLGFFNPNTPGNDAFYGKLSQWDWYYGHSGKTEYDFISRLVASNSNLLDVGCGIGEITRYLPAGVNFTGIELSSKSVEIARSLGRNVHSHDIIDRSEAYKNNYDVVTCFQVMEHIVDIHSFFSSLVYACKPGGTIVLAVPNNDSFVGDAVNNIFNMPPHHTLLWNKGSLKYLAERYNLKILNYFEEEVSDVHRWWAFSVRVRKLISFNNKLKSVDISPLGKLKIYLSYAIAFPITYINRKFVNVGHTSIIVLKKV